jgi:hypothetical protein
MIDRISIVSRLTQVLYPAGVPADRVAHLPHHLALLDVVAESVATGKAPSVPLALMAGDPCPYEPVGGSELDQPVPFVPVVPVPVRPEPTAPVKPATAKAKAKTRGPYKKVDWDAEPRLGVVSDSIIARDHGVAASSVRQARETRGLPSPLMPGGKPREVPAVPAEAVPSATPPKPTPSAPAVTEDRARERELIEAHIKAKGVTKVATRYVEPDSIPANPRGGR